MRRATLIIAGLVSVSLVGAPRAQPQPPAGGNVEQELIALDKQLAEMESKGDAEGVGRILASDYSLVDQTGRVTDRTRALSVLRNAQGGHRSTITTGDYTVRVFGDVAVMTHIGTIKGPEETVERLRTTHVWVKREGRWQLTADQCTTLAFPQLPSNKPFLDAACSEASFAPEVQQFYGTSASIQQKLESAQMRLDRRRVSSSSSRAMTPPS